MKIRIRVPSELRELIKDDEDANYWILASRWVDTEEGETALLSKLQSHFPEPDYWISDSMNEFSIYQGEEDQPLVTIKLVREKVPLQIGNRTMFNIGLYFYVDGSEEVVTTVSRDILAVLETVYQNYYDEVHGFPGNALIESLSQNAPNYSTSMNVNRNLENAIEKRPFEEGEEVIRLNGQKNHVYHKNSLEAWWKIAPGKKNPLTGVSSKKIERGTAKLVGEQTGGYRKSKRKTRKQSRKAQKGRKVRKTRGHVRR